MDVNLQKAQKVRGREEGGQRGKENSHYGTGITPDDAKSSHSSNSLPRTAFILCSNLGFNGRNSSDVTVCHILVCTCKDRLPQLV